MTPLNSSRLLVPHVILVSFPSSSLLASRVLALNKATQCPTCVGPTSAPSNVEPRAPELPCVGAVRRSCRTLESSHAGATSRLSCRACTYLLPVLHLTEAALHRSCPCPAGVGSASAPVCSHRCQARLLVRMWLMQQGGQRA